MPNDQSFAATKQPKVYSPEPPSLDFRLALEQDNEYFESSWNSALKVKLEKSERLAEKLAKAS